MKNDKKGDRAIVIWCWVGALMFVIFSAFMLFWR